ncbi:Pre-mRNA-processing factor 39, putative [Medicago truncatula]|uniref:Pre-mRNA-processing factor 39, putative n=1 Tax=Medicago truncatula TaxID=3880 RepID=A0A072TT59_MEDTR|nr:Pre-mRNA-processing factor 39, putative [Medicago truncatula]
MVSQCLTESPASNDNLELEEVISKGSLDFDEWVSLIADIEKIYPDNVEKICVVYKHFLSEFPLCHGYWRKYAAHMTQLSTMDKVVEVFEQAVSAATYSVGMWVDYCSFGMSSFEDASDIRRLFKRAISFVGKDYLCHTLWDRYIHFEFSQQQWTCLAHIYIQTLKFPTKKLHQYYDSFKKLLTFLEEGITSRESSPKESQSEPCLDGEIPMTMCRDDDEIYCVIKDMVDSPVGLTSSTALKKYRIIGEQLYHNACELYSKISSFEANIQRYYFDFRPLDANQLQNWHAYLDFIELHGDFDWAVKLYERCLIVCANYPDYWMRYADFMEAKGGREIANYSLDRATEIYLKSVPAIHLFNARFKEQIGDVLAARAAYIHRCKETDSDFVENVISKANMEKRLGNMESAFSIYKEALEIAAAEEKQPALPILYVHFSRLKFMSTNDVDAARVVLIDGIRTLPQNKLLLEELMKFSMMHGGAKHIDELDSIIAGAISPRANGSQGLSAEDAEDISNLYLEFVDYCGTIHDVRRALNRHIRLCPGSARIDLRQQSIKSKRPLNLIKDKREEISVAMPNQEPRDPSSNLEDHIIRSYDTNTARLQTVESDDKVEDDARELPLLVSEEPRDIDTARLQTMESDDKAEDNARDLSLSVSEEPRNNDPERNLSSIDLVGAKEESTKIKNFKKDCSESDISSENLLHQIAIVNQPSQALQASSNEKSVSSQGKCELKTEELKPLSVTSAPLNTLVNTCPDSGLVASQVECETIPESCNSNSRAVVGGYTANRYNSSRSTQDSDYPRTHVERNRPYSSSHRDHNMKRPLLPPRFSRNGGGNRDPIKNDNKFRRAPKYGNRGRGGPKYGNREYPRRNEHQHRSLSPQQIHLAERGAQFPVTPGCSQSALQVQQCNQRQDQFQATATTAGFVTPQSWPIQNVQIQNSLPQSQLPVSTTSNVLQHGHAMQGSEQYGYMQKGQDYNQMWQHYYYQQQQLQLQQHYIQLNQQPFQPELSQQHIQAEPFQPQQLQQMQLQQQDLQQHQYFQQQQPQQPEHPVYLQQSNINPVEDQAQAIVMSQQQQQLQLQQHYIQLKQQSFQPELSQQFQQHSQPESLQPQQLQQLQLQQQVLQQQQPQQQEHSAHLQQSSSNPVEDQAQAILTPQGQEAISSQQSGDHGLISSPVLHHPQEKPTQED